MKLEKTIDLPEVIDKLFYKTSLKVIRSGTDNKITPKSIKGQTMIYKTLHRKLQD
jgi:hypothetical protein